MPNRIIKESICESSGLADCSVFAQDLYKRLITYADDYGRFNADTQIMLARLYPRELDSIGQQNIIDALTELDGVGKILFYTSRPCKTVYGCFPNWKEHQRVRDSKAKYPDPDDTSVNDWYLQRFIPMGLKVEIIERDGFKCQTCNRFITSDKDARRLVKLGSGLYHIDPIIPVQQGGRATADNLRLTCPSCTLSRKEPFSFSEIISFAANCRELPRVAASCGELRPESESNPNPNPIQSEKNICSELDAAHSEPPVITLLLNDKTEYPVSHADIAEWRESYPAVDVMQELREMKIWCKDNPARRKTSKGIRRFISSWLSREQDKYHAGCQSSSGTTNQFLALLEKEEEKRHGSG